jgi:subtilisin family serine protease
MALLPPPLKAFARKYRVYSIEPLFNPVLVSPSHIAQIKKQFPRRTFRARHTKQVPRLDNIFKLLMDRQVDLERAAKELSAQAQVIFAEPNRIYRIVYTPNDQYYNSNDLWGLFNVNAATAWNTAKGLGVTVAVIDTGVELSHSDLQPNIWVNTGETNPTDGIDNENNGYIDDKDGWDFAYSDKTPTDLNGHGSHVAGIIGAVGNNTHGVVGLAFQSKIMAVKGLDDGGWGVLSNLAAAIEYATDNGADVINNSWSGMDSQLVPNMIDWAHSMGVVTVSAAGNNNQEACNFCPANVENGLTVSSFKRDDTRSSFSNFGVKIDVGAPGGQGGSPSSLTPGADILSTVPSASFLTGAGYPVFTDANTQKYIPQWGTSFAAPNVSALAALIIESHPTWTNEEIRQAIRQTANDVSNSGFDTDSGYGRINAANAMALGPTAPPSALVQEPHNCKYINGNEPVTGFGDVASGAGTYVVEVGPGDMPSSFVPIGSGSTPVLGGTLATFNSLNVPDGPHTIRLTTTASSSGKTSEDRNLVLVKNVFIVSPSDDEIVTGSSYPVTGQAAGNNGFINYTLEWAVGCNAPAAFQPITTSTTQVNPVGPLGNWNLSTVSSGLITLRLTANFSNSGGFTSQDQKCVIVDKLLAPGWPVAINHVPSFKSPKIADLDGDGTNEIVLGASVFQANGSVRAGWNNFPGLGRTNPAILDVDGTPGTFEVIAAVFDGMTTSPNNGAPVIYAYKHDKTVLWSYTVQNPNTTATNFNHGVPSAISAGDVDGDGQPEIVFTMYFNSFNSSQQTWVFVLEAATGAAQTPFPVPVTGLSRNSVALADVDENGVTDLIVESRINSNNDGLISVLNGLGASLAGWPVQIPFAAHSEGFGDADPVLADVDGDSHLEILVGRHLLSNTGNPKTGWPFSSLSNSTGVMVPLPDADCEMEVVTGGDSNAIFRVAEHTGQMKFGKGRTYENLAPSLTGESRTPGNPVVGDVDGDQEVEILRPSELGHIPAKPIPLYGSDALFPSDPPSFSRFVLNANSGGWADPIRSTAAIGDVDKDGKVDLLVAAGGQLYMWNLNQPFTPSLSYWPMFQHDLRNTGVASSSHWQPDLYMQDTPADAGFEPNTVSPLLYISSDIWVRTAVDTSTGTNPGPNTVPYYVNEHQHENPLYVDASTPSHVYVKVRNRGCKSSTGAEKLRVYWADANTGLPGSPWPPTSAWTELDCVAGIGVNPCSLPVMTPGQDYVVELPWVPPDPVATGTDHYCLVARIETSPTPPFGMTFPESQSPWLWTNVGNNNNVVWKNVTIVLGSARGKVTVSNPFDRAMAFDLHFDVPPAESKDSLLLHGDIVVDLGEDLMTKWRRGGQKAQGFVIVGKTTIKITEPSNAALRGLLLAPREKRTIQVQVQLKPGDQSRPGRQFNWDLIQMAPATRSNKARPVGGERYTLIVPRKPR